MLCMPIFQSMSFSASCDWGADLVTLLTKWAVHSWAYVMLSRAFSQITWITKFKGFPWCGVWLNNVNCVTLRHTLVALAQSKAIFFASKYLIEFRRNFSKKRTWSSLYYLLPLYLPSSIPSFPPTYHFPSRVLNFSFCRRKGRRGGGLGEGGCFFCWQKEASTCFESFLTRY
jgi:hypothetical protein